MINRRRVISLLMTACIIASVPQLPISASEVENAEISGSMMKDVVMDMEPKILKQEDVATEGREYQFIPDGVVNLLDVQKDVERNTVGEYHGTDIAVINQIIENNGLIEQGYQLNDPVNWNFVTWDDEELKRVLVLHLGNRGLSGELDVSGLSKLTYLNCIWNSISELDVSGLGSLTYLNCGNNSLSSLDVSGLGSLTYLNCGSNSLSSLDVGGLSSIEGLDCSSNNLNSLDLGELSSLIALDCSSNNLSSLKVSGLSGLKSLDCYGNNLSSLDLNGLSSLTRLDCESNNLSSLDVNNLNNLTYLYCVENRISELDLSGLSSLENLYCSNNNLNSLVLGGLSSLTNLNCSSNNLSSLDVSGLSSLTGLVCGGNNLNSLDVSGLSNLMLFYCYYNNLSSLDVSGLSSLESLNCSNNNLSSLKISGASNLRWLNCSSNSVSELNASGLNNLRYLFCEINPVRLLKLPGKGTLNINTLTGGSAVTLSGNCIETIGLGVEVLEGYQFQEWKTEGIILGDVTSATIEFEMPDNDVTITPKFTKNGAGNEDTEEIESPHTIIYELNGGRQNSSNPSSYTGESAITLYNPTREGYTFGGWYKESGFSTKVTSITKGATGKLVLYAKWNPISYTITYLLNNGKNNSSNPSTYTIESAVTLRNPTRIGYVFGGWYEESSFKTKVSTINGTARNITLHAKWTADKYTVTFDKNKGTNLRTSSKTVTYGSIYGILPTVVRKGYTLKGWYTKASGGSKVTSNTKVSITKKQTLYAQWTEVKKPGKATVSSVGNNKPKQMAVSLRRVSGASGYEIEYSTNNKFTSPNRVRITSLSRTIKSLRKGRTYFVRARAYRLDSANNRVYGNYSAVRQVKISK